MGFERKLRFATVFGEPEIVRHIHGNRRLIDSGGRLRVYREGGSYNIEVMFERIPVLQVSFRPIVLMGRIRPGRYVCGEYCLYKDAFLPTDCSCV